MQRVWVAMLLACAATAAAARARADRTRISLRYDVPGSLRDACPAEDALRARVIESVGYDAFAGPSPQRAFSLEVDAHARFRARITERSEAGAESVRTISSTASCEDLIESVILAIAVTLDPDPEPHTALRAERAPPEASPDRLAVVSILVPVPVAPPANEGRRSPRPAVVDDGFEGVAVAGFGVGGGFVPGTSTGPSAGLALRRRSWEVGIEGTVILPGSTSGPFGGVEVYAVSGAVVPCYTPSLTAWARALVCGSVSVGALFSSTVGMEAWRGWVDLGAYTGPRAGVALELSRPIELRVWGDLWANLKPQRVDVELPTTVALYEAPPVAGRVVSALAATFP